MGYRKAVAFAERMLQHHGCLLLGVRSTSKVFAQDRVTGKILARDINTTGGILRLVNKVARQRLDKYTDTYANVR